MSLHMCLWVYIHIYVYKIFFIHSGSKLSLLADLDTKHKKVNYILNEITFIIFLSVFA